MQQTATTPSDAKTVEFTADYPGVSVESLHAFHARDDAFSVLNPPPIVVQMHRNELDGLTAGEVEFTLWLGPLPVRWTAQHAPGPNEHSFVDTQIAGPMDHWHHQHIIEASETGARLTDRITIAHKDGAQGILTRLMFDGLPLRIFFAYRHWRTGFALKQSA